MDNNLKTVLIILLPFLIIFFILIFSGNVKNPDDQLVDKESESINLASETSESNPKPPETKPVDMIIKGDKNYKVKIITTAGELLVQLDITNTPITSNNFVSLVSGHFYDSTIFHRVINGFMIQGGDPTGTGSGGPGYNIQDEPVVGEYKRGAIAMANTGQPNSAGSQFFIMHRDNPTLPKNYVIFGQVIEGFEVLDTIASTTVADNGLGEISKPVSPISIISTEVIEE